MRKKDILKKTLISILIGTLALSGLTGCSKASKKEEVVEEMSEEDKKAIDNIKIVRTYVEQLLADEVNNPEDFSKGGFVWDTEKKSDSWRYFNGVMIDSFLQVDEKEYISYAEKFYDDNINEDGAILHYGKSELDSVAAGLGLFYLLESENAAKYEKAINFIYNELEVQTSYDECGGNYQHKPSWNSWNIGLDGIYMAQPFLMRCANAIDDGLLTITSVDGNEVSSDEIYKAVYERMNWVAETMYDETSGLYHHGWSVKLNEGNGHFWGRGIGWYAIALVDVIDGMPEGEYKEQLIKQLPKLFDGMLKYQDEETGMWYNVVNNPELEGNELETSVSSMMAYALMKAGKNEWVDASYGEAGKKAFNGVAEHKVIKNGDVYSVTGVYQKSGVEVNDADYVKYEYLTDEGKGVGALIMAAAVAADAV